MLAEFIKNTPERSQSVNSWLIIAVPFTIPISTSATEILLVCIVVCWLLSGQIRQTLSLLKSNRVVQLAIALFGILALSSLWSTADTGLTLKFLAKYRMLLYVPIYFTVFEQSDIRRKGQRTFCAAMALTLICSYLNCFAGFDIGRDDLLPATVFRDRITQNILLSLFIYFLAVEFVHQHKYRWLMAVFIVAGLFNIVAMSSGRSGYLVITTLACLLGIQKFRIRGLAIAGASLVAIGIIAYGTSSVFQDRVHQTVTGIQNFARGDSNPYGQYRLRLYAEGVNRLKASPLIGTGIGSWGTELSRSIPEDSPFFWDDPHNEYIAMGIHAGALGLMTFLALLGHLWKNTKQLTTHDRQLASGCLATICIGCLVNSLLMAFSFGHLFAYWAAQWHANESEDEAIIEALPAEEDALSVEIRQAA